MCGFYFCSSSFQVESCWTKGQIPFYRICPWIEEVHTKCRDRPFKWAHCLSTDAHHGGWDKMTLRLCIFLLLQTHTLISTHRGQLWISASEWWPSSRWLCRSHLRPDLKEKREPQWIPLNWSGQYLAYKWHFCKRIPQPHKNSAAEQSTSDF